MMIEKAQARPSPAYPIAIVGMHGRFPGARDVREFWDNLCQGIDPITEVPKARWSAEKIFGEPDGTEERTYATTGGFAPHVDCFDCKFFNILPREAESMDPQQRLFLETSWAALEDAGIAPKDIAGSSVGVFVGVGHADYPVLMRRDHAPFDVFRGTGIVPTAIANRVSFALDLRGPSEAIDTACSGSLVAIHRACQAMALKDCELAIAGGVNLLLGPELFIAFAKAGMLSRTGRCRPFDAKGDGYVRGEGVAAVVLKPLHAAEADGDFIYGVIRASAEGHGGKAHSFTAPSVSAQADVITRAWARSGRSVWDACLIETHGTGTRLGDPIEIKALKRVFEGVTAGQGRAKDKTVALGALKSHVGHLEAAAGIAGVLKALLCMQHQIIPKNLHYERLNPEIDLSATPFYFPERSVSLADKGPGALVSGVSSFGFGGSNAHIVLEAYEASRSREPAETTEASVRLYLIPISARSEKALFARVRQLVDFLHEGVAPSSASAPLGKVGEALGLSRLSSESGDIALSALNINPEQLLMALRCFGGSHGRNLALGDMRDCVTLRELAARLSGMRTSTLQPTHPDDVLLPRTVLPPRIMRHTTLAEIAFTLMHGRDPMEERLAVIAATKQELLQKLQRLLSAPQDPVSGCFRGSTRSRKVNDDPVPSEPHHISRDADELEKWGRHWVSSPQAKLIWEAVHRVPRPRKVPLPAYPFELMRIWYVARKATEEKTAARTQAVKGLDEPSEAERPLTPPRTENERSSAFIGLAALLEHHSAKADGKRLELTHIEFGRPVEIGNGALTCRTHAGVIVQCLYDDGGGKRSVLVQGRMAPRADRVVVAAVLPEESTINVSPAEFYARVASAGVTIEPHERCIVDAVAGASYLSLKTELSFQQPDARRFWRSFFATVWAAVVDLFGSERRPSGAPFPFRASGLVLIPEACRGSLEIRLVRSKNPGVDVIALGENCGAAIALFGLEVRHAESRTKAAAASVLAGEGAAVP